MRRLVVLLAVAVAAFAAAVTAVTGQAPQACRGQPPEDGAYAAWLAGPVTVEAGTHELIVTRRGEPVADARVCVAARPADQPARRVAAAAEPQAPGRYTLRAEFAQPGRWRGRVLIARDSDSGEAYDAAVPLRFTVTPSR